MSHDKSKDIRYCTNLWPQRRIATAIVGGPSVSQAQNDRGLEIAITEWFHMDLRPACVRFGVLIGQHTDKWPEWRQTHPEWSNWGRISSRDPKHCRIELEHGLTPRLIEVDELYAPSVLES